MSQKSKPTLWWCWTQLWARPDRTEKPRPKDQKAIGGPRQKEEDPPWLPPRSTAERARELIHYLWTSGTKEMAQTEWDELNNAMLPRTLREFPQTATTLVLGESVTIHILRFLAERLSHSRKALPKEQQWYVTVVLTELGRAGAWRTLAPWNHGREENLLLLAGRLDVKDALGTTAFKGLFLCGFRPTRAETLGFLQHCDNALARGELFQWSDATWWSVPARRRDNGEPVLLQEALYEYMQHGTQRGCGEEELCRRRLVVLESYRAWRRKHRDLICAVTRIVWAHTGPNSTVMDLIPTVLSFLSPHTPSETGRP